MFSKRYIVGLLVIVLLMTMVGTVYAEDEPPEGEEPGEGGSAHPVLALFEAAFEVSGEEIIAQQESGAGFGVLARLYSIAGESDATVGEMTALRKEGLGWGQIFKEYGKPAMLGVGNLKEKGGKPEKVTICHLTGSGKKPGVQLSVNENIVQKFLDKGDTLGACDDAATTDKPDKPDKPGKPEKDDKEDKGQGQGQGQGQGKGQDKGEKEDEEDDD